MKGRFGIEDLEAMAMRFDLDVNAIDLDRYMAPEPPEQKGAAGSAPAAAKAAPPTDLPIEMLRGLEREGPAARRTREGRRSAVHRSPAAARGKGRAHASGPDAGEDVRWHL